MDEVVDVNGITYVLAPKLKKNWTDSPEEYVLLRLLRVSALLKRLIIIDWHIRAKKAMEEIFDGV